MPGLEAVLLLLSQVAVLLGFGQPVLLLALHEGVLRLFLLLRKPLLEALISTLLGSDVLVVLRDCLGQVSFARLEGLALGNQVLLRLKALLVALLQFFLLEGQPLFALGKALVIPLQGSLRSLVGSEQLSLQLAQHAALLR